ncbi:MAG: hypothetical protein GY756_19720 [bacterium]|nr:hypothetical protein [bacterium]
MKLKKCVVLYSMIVSLLLIGVFASAAANVPKNPFKGARKHDSTAIKFCLWPDISWPKNKYVQGLNLGIVSFGDKGYVIGADIGFVSLTKYVRGAQVAIYSQGDVVHGGQAALVNVNKDVIGAQVGIYNGTDVMGKGAQVGIVNNAKASDAIQIGIINIMDNGFLPVFPFFNFPRDWSSK